MVVTPASPGMYAVLPVGTTMTKGTAPFSIFNAGEYDYGVTDSTGKKLGWIRPGTGSVIGCADNSTSAGVWSPYGLEKLGVTAQVDMPGVLASPLSRVVVDDSRTFFLLSGQGVGHYGIVYNSHTLTWGSPVLIRASASYSKAILSNTDQILVTSCDSTTGFQAVTLSLSGTSIAVNTAVTATLAGTIAGFGRMIAVGSSFILAYSRATTTSAVVAITISGTVPTIGSESIVASVATSPSIFVAGSIVRCVVATASQIAVVPYTVSGSTLTAGAAATAPTTAATWKASLNGSGNLVIIYTNTTFTVSISKLTGTTEAFSTVSIGTAQGSYEMLHVGSTKTCIATGANWALLIDTSGTASISTAQSASNGQTPIAYYVDGNTAFFGTLGTRGAGSFDLVSQIDCSGLSPGNLKNIPYQNASAQLPVGTDSDNVMSGTFIVAGSSIYIPTYGASTTGNVAPPYDIRITPNSFTYMQPLPIKSTVSSATGASKFYIQGLSRELWATSSPASFTQIRGNISRIEAAE